MNAAANACLESGWARALQLLQENEHLKLNTVSYNIMLGAFERGGMLGIRDSLLKQMQHCQVRPSLVTYNSLISLCGTDQDWAAALQYLDELWRGDFEFQPDIVSYNSAIKVCQTCSQWKRALDLCAGVQQRALELDAFSFGATVACAAKSRRWRCALSLLRILSGTGIRTNVVVCSSACDALAQHWEKAVGLLTDMAYTGLLPNAFTMSSSIGGCGRGQQWTRPLSMLRWLGHRNLSRPPPEAVSSSMGACAQAPPQGVCMKGLCHAIWVFKGVFAKTGRKEGLVVLVVICWLPKGPRNAT